SPFDLSAAYLLDALPIFDTGSVGRTLFQNQEHNENYFLLTPNPFHQMAGFFLLIYFLSERFLYVLFYRHTPNVLLHNFSPASWLSIIQQEMVGQQVQLSSQKPR